MVKKNAEKDVGFVRQFNELKKKHPDSMLLFRKGDFYEMYKEDALKASVILALKVSEKVIPLEKDPSGSAVPKRKNPRVSNAKSFSLWSRRKKKMSALSGSSTT